MRTLVQKQVQNPTHLRLNIPTDCRQYFNNRLEIKKALPTQSHVHHARLEAKSLFKLIRTSNLNDTKINELVLIYFNQLEAETATIDNASIASGILEAAGIMSSSQTSTTDHTYDGWDWKALCFELLQAQAALLRQGLIQELSQQVTPNQKESTDGLSLLFPNASSPSPPALASTEIATAAASMYLSELAELRVRSIRASGKAPKTIITAQSMYRQFVEVLGDKQLTDYTLSDFLGLQEHLNEKLAPRTVHTKLIALSTLFNFAIKNKLLRESPVPTWEKSKELKRSKGWSPYQQEDYQQLLSTPWFKDGHPVDHRGWLPIISRYSGLRLEEIAQLQSSDIQEHEGVLCFSVNDTDGKRVKSSSSIRFAPVHSRLIELGIQNLGDGKRLLPELENKGLGFSHAYSKSYGRFARKHVTEDRSKVFHSWRKMFAKSMADAGVHREEIGQLLGHEAEDAVTVLYAGEVNIQRLREAVEKIG